jgi:hypothetical protein
VDNSNVDNIEIDVFHGYAVYRRWNNTWLREGWGSVRIFDSPKNAKLAARHDLKSQNQLIYTGSGPGGYESARRSRLRYNLATKNYAVCKVQMITQPVETVEWN